MMGVLFEARGSSGHCRATELTSMNGIATKVKRALVALRRLTQKLFYSGLVRIVLWGSPNLR